MSRLVDAGSLAHDDIGQFVSIPAGGVGGSVTAQLVGVEQTEQTVRVTLAGTTVVSGGRVPGSYRLEHDALVLVHDRDPLQHAITGRRLGLLLEGIER